MSDRPVGAVAVYDDPDALVQALQDARVRGFTRLDVATPYPLHGIDDLLGKPASRLGYVALAAGLLAVVAAKTMQWWMSAVDYPLNVGGKPLFSWPAFVPVTFELMVLVTSVTTVFAMIVVMNRLPRYGSALLGARAIASLTRDRFGLVVDARDPKFNAATVGADLATYHRSGVELLVRRDIPMAPRVFSAGFAAFLVVVAVACGTMTHLVFRYGGDAPLFDFMKRQPRVNPQSLSAAFADGRGMQLPAEGTVALDEAIVTGLTPDEAGAVPDPVPLDAASMARGRSRFGIYCQPCHGLRADGHGTLTSAFPQAPSLQSAKVRGWTDGRLFHVVSNGQNVMPSYAAQIAAIDRWHTIHFVRALQRSANAPDRDLP